YYYSLTLTLTLSPNPTTTATHPPSTPPLTCRFSPADHRRRHSPFFNNHLLSSNNLIKAITLTGPVPLMWQGQTKMGRTKKTVKYVVVDAFTDTEFKGNPAAVCLLEETRDEEWLQSLASEFNISETCFLTRITDSDSVHPRFHLRWFTPVAELTVQVELCGHATLAAAHFCFSSKLVTENTVEFSTLSGILTAKNILKPKEPVSMNSENGDAEQQFLIELDFPAISTTDCPGNEASLLSNVLSNTSVIEYKQTALEDYFVVLPSADAITAYQPNLEEIKQLPGRGLIISAAASPESGFDFLSRFFCPKFGIDEDPVCGSAHCALALYWSKKLGKCDFVAYAASPRSGIVRLHLDEQTNRVKLQGEAVIVMEGSVIV
ncbi:hypothetical protein KSS87_000759, partial [Heliosperma pusillum]